MEIGISRDAPVRKRGSKINEAKLRAALVMKLAILGKADTLEYPGHLNTASTIQLDRSVQGAAQMPYQANGTSLGQHSSHSRLMF